MRTVHRATLPSAGAALLLLVLLAGTGSGSDHDHGDGAHVEHHGDGAHVEHHGDDAHVEHHEHDDRQEEYEALDHRLDRINARIQHMDAKLDFRLGSKLRQKAMSLQHRIAKFEEKHCNKHHYDCGGRDHECLSRLKVCDGHKDCRNGDDEKHCSIPTKAGDTFVGHVVFDHCTQRHPDTLQFTITAVKASPAFKGFPRLRAVIDISKKSKDYNTAISLPTVGYFNLATHNLVLMPPEADGLGLVCDFDGYNHDKCVGNIMPQTSLKTCAQFIFFRKHH